MNVPFWTEEHVRATLPERDAESHKGTYGTALLLAGSDDMPGAALLAGLGAMRSGLGKLVIGTSESVMFLFCPRRPIGVTAGKRRRMLSLKRRTGPLPSDRAFRKRKAYSRQSIMCLRLIVLLFWMPERWRSAHIRNGRPPSSSRRTRASFPE